MNSSVTSWTGELQTTAHNKSLLMITNCSTIWVSFSMQILSIPVYCTIKFLMKNVCTLFYSTGNTTWDYYTVVSGCVADWIEKCTWILYYAVVSDTTYKLIITETKYCVHLLSFLLEHDTVGLTTIEMVWDKIVKLTRLVRLSHLK